MSEPVNKQIIDWDKLKDAISGLDLDVEHLYEVQREAIPLVFLPGIMGSVLRRPGTNGIGEDADGLPNLRWNPGDSGWMWWQYSGMEPQKRRRMIIGPDGVEYSKDFLEVHNADPIGNGFQGVSSASYHGFLEFLQNQNHWGPLNKVFDFPVYAIGYNWSDTNLNNGKEVNKRIDDIIKEAKGATGRCEKVIVITHSMGGLVGRSASELAGANSKILGMIHGVQPVTGACAAYWRVKAGFEGNGIGGKSVSRVLGNSGPNVTAILGNMPGGLELLPNKQYRTGDDASQWLTVSHNKKIELSLPKSDPYSEIYKIQGTGNEVENPERKFWGLIDPDLLDPSRANSVPQGGGGLDEISANSVAAPWDEYINQINKAETFHALLGSKLHKNSFCFHGIDHITTDRIEFVTDTVWVERDAYRKREFWGRFEWSPKGGKKEQLRGKLQQPNGDGDGTVAASSGSALSELCKQRPLPLAADMEHEPAFEDSNEAREFVIQAILAICQEKVKKAAK